MDFADILRQKTARRLDVTIVLRSGLDDTGAPTEDTAVVTFEAVGRVRMDELLSKHQPSEAARRKARQKQMTNGVRPADVADQPWDTETFPPALIAMSAVAPPITLDEATEMWNSPEWSAAELDKMFSGALIVNSSDESVRLGKGYEAILASKRN